MPGQGLNVNIDCAEAGSTPALQHLCAGDGGEVSLLAPLHFQPGTRDD